MIVALRRVNNLHDMQKKPTNSTTHSSSNVAYVGNLNELHFVKYVLLISKKRTMFTENKQYLTTVLNALATHVSYMRVTPPPPFGTQYSVFFRRYAVRKGLVRSTQKFCYIVRRHQFLL